jgi:hypothetical protein
MKTIIDFAVLMHVKLKLAFFYQLRVVEVKFTGNSIKLNCGDTIHIGEVPKY